MRRGRNAAWQPPTPEQRELLRVVLLADFPNRDAIAAHLDDLRVQPSCGCGCDSMQFCTPVPIELIDQEWPVHLAGDITTGTGALVLLFAHGGQRFELEIAPVDNGDFGRLDPTTIREYDRTVDASGAVTWVARELSLLNTSSRAHPHPNRDRQEAAP